MVVWAWGVGVGYGDGGLVRRRAAGQGSAGYRAPGTWWSGWWVGGGLEVGGWRLEVGDEE